MNDKYYTPDIEEFHVGFLFETYESRHDRWKLTSIHNMYDYQAVFNLGLEKNRNGRVVNSNSIRVKYLDEEDIESLGFKEDTYNGVKCFTKNNCQIFLFHNLTSDCNIISIDLFAGEFRNQYFRGLVKNKSELKTIIKQIANGI